VSTRLLGRRLLRQEDPRLVTGNGRYVTDLALPGTLHMALARSPHAHARIAAVDVSRAHRVPGVVAVLTADDLRDAGPLPVLAHPPGQRQSGFPVLPGDRVRYVGQALAAVVAETRYAAQDGIDALDVTYGPLPAVADGAQATAPGAPKLYDDWPDYIVVSRRDRQRRSRHCARDGLDGRGGALHRCRGRQRRRWRGARPARATIATPAT